MILIVAMGLDHSNSHAIRTGLTLCLMGAALGVIGLIGCLSGVEMLANLRPGQPPLVPNACLALALLGLAGAAQNTAHTGRSVKFVSVSASVVVLALGLATLGEHVLPFSIDNLIVSSDPETGRASPPVAIALILLSAAILASERRTTKDVRPSEWLILCAGLISFTFAVAPLFPAGSTDDHVALALSGFPVAAAIGLVLVSVGLLLGKPDSALMRIAAPATPGGIMLRRLIPTFVAMALALGLGGSLFVEFAGPQYVALARAGVTLFGIALVVPLFVITARRLNRAHEALESSEVRYRELIQLASDGIFVADLEGRFTEVNDAGCRLLGFSREELLGRTIMDFILPEEKERLFKDRERFLNGASDVGEWMLLRKDGSYIPVEVSAKILPDGRWLAIDRDISERRRTLQVLQLSEAAAKRASQARDDMLGVVAHDLRNPLATIATLAVVLQMKGQDPDIGKEIAQAATRMTRLIRDLIDATLLGAGRFTIKQERIGTNEILSKAFESQSLLASSASLALRLDAAQALPDIAADRDRLLQVFENLIGNAIKFTEPGGEIILGADAGAGDVLFSVADTGCGIASDQVQHIFDRFWQGPEGKRRGAGLGLPIVKDIVEAHGGRIWVQSSPGQGATFFFTIATAQTSEHCSDTAPIPDLEHKTHA